MSDWQSALLGALQMPRTPQNVRFLTTWQRYEGGDTHNSARFNYLNTTHGPGKPINSVGVKAFPSFQVGIRSLAETLQNGRYGDILKGLQTGNPYDTDVSAGLQTWVSGRPDGNPAYAAKITGHAPLGPPPPPPQARAKVTVQRVKGELKKVSPNPDWDRAMRLIFDDDPEMSQLMAAMDDRMAQASGLVSPRGSIRPIASTIADTPAYVFGSGPDTSSFDCSDLIQWAYKQCGISLGRDTYAQIHEGRSVKGQKLKPGDLVFPSTHHVVMYVGDGKVIAAPHTGTVVQYQPLSRFGSIVDVRRVL